MVSKEVQKLQKWYKEELKQKDKEIAELKENNIVLLKAAMNQSHKFEDMKKKFEKLMQK